MTPSNPGDEAPRTVLGRFRSVALAGNPNSGKTTLFNALTGLRQKVANYPGVTVEKKLGRCVLPGGSVDVLDLPGTYSLVSRSPDEAVACEVLRGLRPDTPAPDAVVVVVDASNLQRNLYLVSQLIELGKPTLVALTMTDVARRRGRAISAERLEAILGVPVVPLVAHKGTGVDELKRRLPEARVAPLPELGWPQAMREEVDQLAGGLATLDGGGGAGEGHKLEPYRAIAERLLIGDRSADLARVYERDPVRSLLAGAGDRLRAAGIDPMQADIEAHYQWIDDVVSRALEPACEQLDCVGASDESASAAVRPAPLPYARAALTLTDRLDRVLIHRVWGLIVFAAVMAALFVSIFTLAAPLMDATEGVVSWLGGLVTDRLPDGPLRDLWADGIVAGVGGVVVFVPQIAILFAFLAVLEDSGYLARAAFLMDRLLSKVGLSGKAFIPLLSSFACAIPGIMAARTIESRKQRMATILVAPFMSCSARLPVYTLLIGAFFAAWGALAQAGVMLGLYLLGIIAAIATAWAIDRFGPREQTGSTGFILELPTYKLPQLGQVLRQVWSNTTQFVTKAGTIIFCLSVVLWAMTYYPRLPENAVDQARQESKSLLTADRLEKFAAKSGMASTDPRFPMAVMDALEEEAVAAAQLRHSIAGRLGHLMEPAIRPLGYDWKMGVGLVSAFAAREVFVSTMGIVYSAGDTEESTDSLAEAMKADVYPDGRPVWTIPVAVSLLVWFVLAMQCMSTLAIVRRETGSWRWPVLMLLYMNAVAYAGAFVTYQLLVRLM